MSSTVTATAQATGQVADFRAFVGRQADEDPGIGAPGVPEPQLSVKDDLHGASLPHPAWRQVPSVVGAGKIAAWKS
jgi:hypothetical protein